MKISIEKFGTIKACEKYLPKCSCCEFTTNYIVLYPGEFEASKLNKNHLKIIDDNYFGGKKAVCTKRCKNKFKSLGLCTKADFKSFDCKIYPYFPKIDKQGKIKFLKGKKCPLTKKELAKHRKECLKICKQLLKDKEFFNWVKKVKLVGYELEK